MIYTRQMELSVKVAVLLCLVLFLPGTGITSEKSHLPEWVVDNIPLQLPENAELSSAHVSLDKEHNYIITYRFKNNGKGAEKGINVFTQRPVVLPPEWARTWEIIPVLKAIKVNNIFYDISSCCIGRDTACETPIGYGINLIDSKNSSVHNYILIFSSPKKSMFSSNKSCRDIDEKLFRNRSYYPRLIPVGKDRVLIGSYDSPYFILIDQKKMDQALKETNIMVYDKAGVKGYWVKKEIVSQWQSEIEKNYDAKKMKKRFYQYFDEVISKKLEKEWGRT